jgi:hypothetical protein
MVVAGSTGLKAFQFFGNGLAMIIGGIVVAIAALVIGRVRKQ